MIPIVTPEEMAAIDAAAPEPVDVLIERAGAAVAREALTMLGGAYGRRVTVVAGKGNNGADGRIAAERLRRRGVAVEVLSPDEQRDARLDRADLLIDAAFGTGFVDRGGWAPLGDVPCPVLAVDIPSGVSGLTGESIEGVSAADRTVTFAALKPGLVLHPGRRLAGTVCVADIGLDSSRSRAALVTDEDVSNWLAPRPPTAHKWQRAVLVVAGSPSMPGAGKLVVAGALRAGASMVVSGSPGLAVSTDLITEAVSCDLSAEDWTGTVLDHSARTSAVVLGPGLGRSETTDLAIRQLVGGLDRPVVVDADAITAVSGHLDMLRRRTAPTVLTPHDGEYGRLMGRRPEADRFAAARALAAATGATALLKGATTVIAGPDGFTHAVTSGSPALATAGTGDVLAGIIAALISSGLEPAPAAAAGAHLHGRAGAALGTGLVASDLPPAVATTMADLTQT